AALAAANEITPKTSTACVRMGNSLGTGELKNNPTTQADNILGSAGTTFVGLSGGAAAQLTRFAQRRDRAEVILALYDGWPRRLRSVPVAKPAAVRVFSDPAVPHRRSTATDSDTAD